MPRKIPRFLSKDEMKALMESTKKESPRDHMMIQMLCFLGLRISELTKLTADDIDFSTQQVFISQGKGHKDRIVTLPAIQEFTENLKTWVAEHKKRLFDISDRQVERLVKHYSEEAKIKRPLEIHPHTLRHSYATHLVDKTGDIMLAKEQLGHSNLATTQIYVHMATESRKRKTDEAFKDW